jgi:hypothetical protein
MVIALISDSSGVEVFEVDDDGGVEQASRSSLVGHEVRSLVW